MIAVEQTKVKDDKWSLVIKPVSGLFDINFREIWQYRDLLMLLVRRDFVAFYKQTVLGPIWFFIQPLMTTVMYFLIFGKVANLSTDGIPPILFYLAGVTCWSYFSETLLKTSDTFIANANIFGKVYFPRLIIPASIVLSNLIRFGIQFLLFFMVWIYYLVSPSGNIQPNWTIALLPYLIFLMVLLSFGLGVIFSALTTKYRDLRFLLTFGVQLLMFATPVVYPLSLASKKYRVLIESNPFTSIIETFRYAFTGAGSFSFGSLAYSTIVSALILFVGIVIFNKIEKSFMDTV
jgi:lipopolysaccharide transport system permease protein